MDDLISRQAAIDAVNCVMVMKGIRSGKSIVAEAVESAKRIMTDNIRDLPPAQPKRGKWEMGMDERFVQCSECGLMTTRNELRGLAVFGKNEPNFCPKCGAEMEVTT